MNNVNLFCENMTSCTIQIVLDYEKYKLKSKNKKTLKLSYTFIYFLFDLKHLLSN